MSSLKVGICSSVRLAGQVGCATCLTFIHRASVRPAQARFREVGRPPRKRQRRRSQHQVGDDARAEVEGADGAQDGADGDDTDAESEVAEASESEAPEASPSSSSTSSSSSSSTDSADGPADDPDGAGAAASGSSGLLGVPKARQREGAVRVA
eukprot:14913174-Alexandrium_andersonii.AAC.1